MYIIIFVMFFNGLLTYGDSDTSDFTKESICASSAAGSGGSDAARAQHYHSKLLATLQILHNKEETVRVQSESLAVAEGRIASLAVRVAQLRRERDNTAQELRVLRQTMNSSRMEKTEVSTAAQTQGDCTCGFQEENTRLKQKNEFMEKQLGELRQRVCDLETTLLNRDNKEQEYREHIELREKELDNIRQQLTAIEEKCTHQSNTCDSLRLQLQQTQVLLNDKTTELFEVQQQCQSQEVTMKDLNEELNKAEKIIQENSRVRAEVSCLTQQVAMWRSRLADSEATVSTLEQQLRLAKTHCQELDECYRQKSERALALQAQLGAAQARGAALCDESRRVVCAVRHWMRRMRDKQREQQEKLKEQETIIRSLRQHLGADEDNMSMKESEPCCSRRFSNSEVRQRERSRVRANGTSSCSKCSRSERVGATSENASCSSAPVPPRRWRTKLSPCGDKRCRWSGVRDACVQEPVSSEAGTDPPSLRDVCCRHATRPQPDTIARAASPSVELFERVERLHEAWLAGPRRWSRSALQADTQ